MNEQTKEQQQEEAACQPATRKWDQPDLGRMSALINGMTVAMRLEQIANR